MSPEQTKSPSIANARTDVYSIGITAYRILTARFPDEQRVTPHTLRPEINDAISAWVMRSIELDPVSRPEDAREQLTLLEVVLR